VESSEVIVLIDNYDSFTYNLVQRIGELDAALPIHVYRNDQVDVARIEEDRPDHLIISPGPCTPREGGISNETIRHFSGRVPILGVCLGHQCIAYSFGAEIVRAGRLMHGKTSSVRHDERGIYEGVANPFVATRYHSLIINPESLPSEFEVAARTDGQHDEIMGIRHRELPIDGVQFHPESFLTDEGPKILANFLGLRQPRLSTAQS
jgi:anthranilate synthase/aminodeoxychorismate synthase-like glutamine amidotransferase